MTYSEWLRPDHRLGLEAAGYDELEAIGEPPEPAEVVPPAPFELDVRCRHGYRDCYVCDNGAEWHRG